MYGLWVCSDVMDLQATSFLTLLQHIGSRVGHARATVHDFVAAHWLKGWSCKSQPLGLSPSSQHSPCQRSLEIQHEVLWITCQTASQSQPTCFCLCTGQLKGSSAEATQHWCIASWWVDGWGSMPPCSQSTDLQRYQEIAHLQLGPWAAVCTVSRPLPAAGTAPQRGDPGSLLPQPGMPASRPVLVNDPGKVTAGPGAVSAGVFPIVGNNAGCCPRLLCAQRCAPIITGPALCLPWTFSTSWAPSPHQHINQPTCSSLWTPMQLRACFMAAG